MSYLPEFGENCPLNTKVQKKLMKRFLKSLNVDFGAEIALFWGK